MVAFVIGLCVSILALILNCPEDGMNPLILTISLIPALCGLFEFFSLKMDEKDNE